MTPITRVLGCIAASGLAVLLALACVRLAPGAGSARLVDPLPWHSTGVWLDGDLHIHELFSAEQGSTIAGSSAAAGLDFIVSSEHAEKMFDEQPRENLTRLRAEFPGMIVLAGVEWNLPAGDHATLIVEQTEEEIPLLERFAQRFDRKVNPQLVALHPEPGEASWGELSRAIDGFGWLRSKSSNGGPLHAVYLNHLSRHNYLSQEQIVQLVEAGLHGIESAAGYQKLSRPGTKRSLDRHDPFVAIVGGGLDQLLASSHFVGLSASSDFHKKTDGYYPGEFSRTLVYSPDRTPRGVVRGLRAGSTVTVLGGIATRVETRLHARGSETFALIGETLRVATGVRLIYEILLEVPPTGTDGTKNRLDEIQVISNCLGSPQLLGAFRRVGPSRKRLELSLPPRVTSTGRSCYLRTIGRRRVGGPGNDRENADLLFYTAATRLDVVDDVAGPASAADQIDADHVLGVAKQPEGKS